jgi:hypothetical protein
LSRLPAGGHGARHRRAAQDTIRSRPLGKNSTLAGNSDGCAKGHGFGVKCPVLHIREKAVETNQYFNQIEDLKERTAELRGYL